MTSAATGGPSNETEPSRAGSYSGRSLLRHARRARARRLREPPEARVREPARSPRARQRQLATATTRCQVAVQAGRAVRTPAGTKAARRRAKPEPEPRGPPRAG